MKKMMRLISVALCFVMAAGMILPVYATAPGITTEAAYAIGCTEATLSAYVETNGGNSFAEHGFCYGTTSSCDQRVAVGDNSGKSTSMDTPARYIWLLNSLEPDTTYYYKAYVLTTAGAYYYGGVGSFTTLEDNESPMINNITSSAGTSFEAGTTTTFSTKASDNVELDELEMVVDDVTVAEEYLNATAGLSRSISYTAEDLTPGNHTVTVYAWDTSGNGNETSITVTVVDNNEKLFSADVFFTYDEPQVGELIYGEVSCSVTNAPTNIWNYQSYWQCFDSNGEEKLVAFGDTFQSGHEYHRTIFFSVGEDYQLEFDNTGDYAGEIFLNGELFTGTQYLTDSSPIGPAMAITTKYAFDTEVDTTKIAELHNKNVTVSANSIFTLSWDAAADAEGYALYFYREGETGYHYATMWRRKAERDGSYTACISDLGVGVYKVHFYTLYTDIGDWKEETGPYSEAIITVTEACDADFSLGCKKIDEDESYCYYELTVPGNNAEAVKYHGTCFGEGYSDETDDFLEMYREIDTENALPVTIEIKKGITYWFWAVTDKGEVSNRLIISEDECEHAYDPDDYAMKEDGTYDYVFNSGKWMMVNEETCKKLVRHYMICKHCGTKVEGTELIPDGSVEFHAGKTTAVIEQLPSDHADYATKHQVTTTYSACTRNCGYVIETEVSTVTEEHQFEDGVCQCGYEQPRPVWDFERDSFSFLNWEQDFGEGKIYVKKSHLDAWIDNLSKSDLYKLARNYADDKVPINGIIRSVAVERFKNNELATWQGSCFGISLATGLFRTGALTTTQFENAATTKELPKLTADTNNDLESLINIFHMAQDLSCVIDDRSSAQVGYDSFSQLLQKLWTAASSINEDEIDRLFLLLMASSSGGAHCVVCYGVERGTWTIDNKEYTRRFLLADPNCITRPSYVYVTKMFDDAVYSAWHPVTEQNYQKSYDIFGWQEFKLDTSLLDALGIPSAFRKSTEAKTMCAQIPLTAEENTINNKLIIDFRGDQTYTISSVDGTTVIENGVIVSDTLGIQLHRRVGFSEEVMSFNQFYVLLPQGVEYTVTSCVAAPMDIMINYSGLIFNVNGDLTSVKFDTDRTLTVLKAHGAFSVDVVNDEGQFDFVNISGKAETEVKINTDADHNVQVSGEWENCTVSHMERNLDKTSLDVSGNDRVMLSLNESSELVAFSDKDKNGTYETEIQTPLQVSVMADQKLASIRSMLPVNGKYLIIAQYDENGKQLNTECLYSAAAGTVEKSILLVEDVAFFKGFILDGLFRPLREAIIEFA